MGYVLSEYQQAILRWVQDGEGNLVVKATAGSGKTFTTERIAELLPMDGVNKYLAFGRLNAEEAKKKMPSWVLASTFNSLCFRAMLGAFKVRGLGYVKTEPRNNDKIVDELWGKGIDPIRSVVVNLVGKVKSENLGTEVSDCVLADLLEQYGLEWDDADFTLTDVCESVRKVLAECESEAGIKRRGSIDFDDQLWLTVRWGIRLEQVDWLLVDEAQDTNVLQREIMQKVMGKGSRLVAVGDDCQAIYGFRGASSDALGLIAAEFSCKELPLSISYRCPRSVVEEAKKFGTIEAAEDAAEGKVWRVGEVGVRVEDVGQLELVLCRNTAPLITLAYKLISARVRVMVRGRDIGEGLKSLVRKLSGKSNDLELLLEKVEGWRAREVSRAVSKRQDSKAQSVEDKATSIGALVDSMTEDETSKGVQGLLSSVDALFSDDGVGQVREGGVLRHRVCLATVHKAKGLEASQVGVLDRGLMPSKYARTADSKKQERNVQFVALTRSKGEMVYFESEQVIA